MRTALTDIIVVFPRMRISVNISLHELRQQLNNNCDYAPQSYWVEVKRIGNTKIIASPNLANIKQHLNYQLQLKLSPPQFVVKKSAIKEKG